MARMVRKQICITDELDRRLEAMAASRHVSQSEIVRDALTTFVDQEDAQRQARAEAMNRFLQLSKHARFPVGWKPLTREEAHDRGHLR